MKHTSNAFRLTALLLALAMLLSLAGCGSSQTAETPAETETETAASETSDPGIRVTPQETPAETETEAETRPSETAPEGMARSILTGEWIDADLAARRPVAVMINNIQASLPQSNITNAQVVYEINVEGGLTRFMALFEDWDEYSQIGTIRSTRPYYVYLSQEWDAVLMHIGQCNWAEELVDSSYVDNVNGVKDGSFAYFRLNHKTAPNNCYTSADNIRSAIEYFGYDMTMPEDIVTPFRYAIADETVDMTVSTPATEVHTGISSTQSWYEYNEEDGLYYRYQFGSAHRDELDRSRQVTARNIIIQYVTHDYYGESAYLNMHIVGSGTGYYITDGQCIPITWSKADNYSPTVFRNEAGNEVIMNPGTTWITLVPDYRMQNTSIS